MTEESNKDGADKEASDANTQEKSTESNIGEKRKYIPVIISDNPFNIFNSINQPPI